MAEKNMNKFDVVIIGGGPGGVKAARVLTNGGTSVEIGRAHV